MRSPYAGAFFGIIVCSMDDREIPPIAQHLGGAILHFNTLEFSLRWTLAQLISFDRDAANIMAFGDHASFEWVRQQLRYSVEERVQNDQQLKDDWFLFLDRLGIVQQDRNRLAHDLWTVQNGDGDGYALSRIRIRVKKGVRTIEKETLPDDYILTVNHQLSDLSKDHASLYSRLRAAGAFQWQGV
jgi:hypothetical protein